MPEQQFVDIELAVASVVDRSLDLVFEPHGSTFSIAPGKSVKLRMPLAEVASLEILMWPTGLSVCLPSIEDNVYSLLDQEGNLIESL